jgi:hypothetical protein
MSEKHKWWQQVENIDITHLGPKVESLVVALPPSWHPRVGGGSGHTQAPLLCREKPMNSWVGMRSKCSSTAEMSWRRR